jgi:DNA-binding PadR family transcriptional regulator
MVVTYLSNRYIPRVTRQAQTATAVLGVLSIEPMTGYEVRQAIGAVLGHFWHESFGQIYPTLAALAEQGLVGATPGDRAGSTRYAITEPGRRRLRDLLREPVESSPPRNPTLLRVFLGASQSPADLAAVLDAHEDRMLTLQASYQRIRAGLGVEGRHPDHLPYWLATVRAGELAADAQLQWIAEARTALLPPR